MSNQLGVGPRCFCKKCAGPVRIHLFCCEKSGPEWACAVAAGTKCGRGGTGARRGARAERGAGLAGRGRLLGPEQVALHHRVDQRADAVVLCFRRGDDRVDGGAIGEADGGAGGEHDELAREVAGEQGVLGA